MGILMFRTSYSPKAYISNVLYSEDSIVRKFLFRRFDIPKVLQGPMFRKIYSEMDDHIV